MFKRLLLTAAMALTLTVTLAGTVSAAPAQTTTAPTPCVQNLTVYGQSGWGGVENIGFGIGFAAACPGRILAEWQAIGADGKVVWKSSDHNVVVSTTTTSNHAESSLWVFGKTPPGTYDVYVTLASQNGKVTYVYLSVMQLTLPTV